ncbi:MAG: hypothetical protein Q9217_003281 [Psora testacea]
MSLLEYADLIVIKYSERSMDVIPEDQPVTVNVTLALMPEIPPIKYHDGPLQFLSKPQLSQKEYERGVLDRGTNPDNESDDDTITIRCPDGEESQARIFKVNRRTLSRSPTFAKFFESAYYLPHSEMLVSFMNDPAAVFDIVKRYLEQGPELFDLAILSIHVHRRYMTLERTVVLVRLCRMSHNMGLWYLHDMAFEILVDANHLLTASMLPTIASLIFASKANYDRHLKEWCLLHAGHHFAALKDSAEWAHCLAVSEEELRTEWKTMVKQNEEILNTLEEVADDGVLEGIIHRMSLQEQRLAISVIEGNQPRIKSFGEGLMTEAPRNLELESDLDEWEDVTAIGSPATGEENRTSTNTKTRAMLSTNGRTPSLLRSSNAETAKARLVMGIDDGYVRKSTEVRRAKGRRSRILSILH